MPTSQMQLAVLEPEDMNAQVAGLAYEAREQLDLAWTALNVDCNVEATNNALVLIDEKMRGLRAFGEAATAALIILQQDRQILEQQRNEAIQGKVEAEERADLAEDHAERLVENMEGMVQEKVESALAFNEMMWENDLDTESIYAEEEEAMLDDLHCRVACLRYEGQEADAAELEQAIATYIQAAQAMTDAGTRAVAKLVDASNARRAAEGLEPEPWYKVPDALRGELDDGGDDGEDEDDIEDDISGDEFEEDDAA